MKPIRTTYLSYALVLGALISLAVFLNQSLIAPWNSPQDAWGDFGAYYMAGHSILQNQPLYDHLEVCRTARSLGATKGVPRFGYPPFTAVLFAPLAAVFDAVGAYRCSLIAYQLLFWLSVGMILRLVRARLTLQRGCLVIIAVSWFTPCWVTLQSGQINMVILFLCTLGLYAASRCKPALSGFSFAVAAMIKIFPGIVLLAFALRRRWSALLGMAAAGIVLLGLSLIAAGPGDHRHYIKVEIPRNAEKIHGGHHNIAVNSLIYRTINFEQLTPAIAAASDSARNATLAARLILILACTALMIWPGHRGPWRMADRLALCLTTAMMINAWTWTHHLVVALPFLALAGRRMLDGTESPARLRNIMVFVAFGLMAIGHELTWLVPWVAYSRELLRSSSLNFYGLLLLWGVLAQLIITRERPVHGA